MNLLLDTHAFIWWFVDQSRLPVRVLDAIQSSGNHIFVSAVTALEINTKYRLGKLPIVGPFVDDLEDMFLKAGFEPLPVEFRDGVFAGQLAFEHRDPFDRLLIAQALIRDYTLVSNEAIFDITQVNRLWS